MTFRNYNIQQPPATCPWLQGTVYCELPEKLTLDGSLGYS